MGPVRARVDLASPYHVAVGWATRPLVGPAPRARQEVPGGTIGRILLPSRGPVRIKNFNVNNIFRSACGLQR
jgi:hypothetical protein